MLDHRPFVSLGRFANGWLDARYHFSFSAYHDPARMGWGPLRVWNDDRIKPKTGFSPHSHADMEIITFVRTGAITHEDSLGNRGRTAAGDVQVMSAGSGVTHAEFNLEDVDTTLFQIWIEPKVRGGAPAWGTAQFPSKAGGGQFVTLASGFEDDLAAGALPIRQDARVRAATLGPGEEIRHVFDKTSRGYLVVDTGRVALDGAVIQARDGIGISNHDTIEITSLENSRLVLVETQ
jgi:hypothetical protein